MHDDAGRVKYDGKAKVIYFIFSVLMSSSSSGRLLIRSLATSALRCAQMEAGSVAECVRPAASFQLCSRLGDSYSPFRAYSASSGPSSSSSTSAKERKSLGESLFDIKGTRAFVEAATSNSYVQQRLGSVLERPAAFDAVHASGATDWVDSADSVDAADALEGASSASSEDALTEMFRYHNSSMLQQLSEGHMVKATVVKVDKRKATLDLRNGKFATIGVHELTPDSVLERKLAPDAVNLPASADSPSGDALEEAPPASGDTVQVFLESIETPEGNVLVRGQESAVSRRTKAVWQELLERLKDGKPVKGRLLNSLAGGYSVGVAGIVCFLPNRNASKVTASRIGELSEYRVIQMNASRSNVVLSDCRMKRGDRDGRGRRGGGRQRGGELLRY